MEKSSGLSMASSGLQVQYSPPQTCSLTVTENYGGDVGEAGYTTLDFEPRDANRT
jgi:hypothetical protein